MTAESRAAWEELHRRAAAAFDRSAGAVTAPQAPTPAGEWTAAEVIAHVRAAEDPADGPLIALQMSTLDLAVHSWDLALSQGGRPLLDEELCTALCEAFAPYTDLMAQEGAFAPPVPVGEDAGPLERLVALCGRDPGRLRRLS